MAVEVSMYTIRFIAYRVANNEPDSLFSDVDRLIIEFSELHDKLLNSTQITLP